MSISQTQTLVASIVAASTLLWSTNALAVTYLDDCANNGVTLKSQISLGYLDTPGGGFTAVTGTFPAGSPPPPGLDHATTTIGPVLVVNPTTSGSTATTPPILIMTPATGDPKDRVEIKAEAYFEFGTPSGTQPADTFRFRADGLASAVGALLLSGNPADAQTRVVHRIGFFNDVMPAGGPATTCSGVILLPNMRTLQPFEVTLKLEVIENPAVSPITLLTQSPGDPATSFILVPGTGYELRYEYEYIVPHGVDPPFDGAYSLTVSSPPAVPMFSEGMFVLLLGLSGTGWWMLRAMRRRGDFHG